MYVSKALLSSNSDAQSHDFDLPPEVRSLRPTQRGAASIVYRNPLSTAKEVQEQLSGKLTNATVRSALNRLVAKGILLRRQCGGSGQFVYSPALTGAFASESLLEQFAIDFYEGSAHFLANEIADFYARRTTLAELLQSYDDAPPPEVSALPTRMREIATAIYRDGSATIKDIHDALAEPLTTSAVRTIVGRLKRRGLVTSRPGARHHEQIYLPTILTRKVRRLALWRMIAGRFDGEPAAALQTILHVERGRHLS